jgi:hypothetical protein
MKPKLKAHNNASSVPRAGLALPESGDLPTAGVAYAGQLRFSDGLHYACVDTGGGSYAWVGLTPFRVLTGTAVGDPASASGDRFVTQNVTVTGVAATDFVHCNFSAIDGVSNEGVVVGGHYGGTDTVTCVLANSQSTAFDAGSGTWTATVFKFL